MNRTSVLLGLLIGSAVPALAFAQTAPADATPPPPAAAPTTQESTDIIVTAQRRSERLADVPVSVTALSAQTLNQAGVTSTGDLGRVTPGLTMDRSGPFSQPTIRGIGSSVTGPGIGTSVATYIDGFYQPSTMSDDFELADVNSIQVLKGPQGTLFGRNSTGGAILVTTVDPTFTPSGHADVSYGSYNDVHASALISGGITNTLAAYASVYYHYDQGYSTDIVTGAHDQSEHEVIARGKLLWTPASNLKFTLSYAHGFISNPWGVAQVAYNGISAAAGEPGVVVPDNPFQTAATQKPVSTVLYDNIYLNSQIDLGGVTLKSLTGYHHESDNVGLDSDKTAYAYQFISFQPADKTFTQEFNLSSSKPGRLQWVAGLYYYYDRAAYNNLDVTQGTAPAFKYLDGRLNTDAYSAFGDVTWEPVDHLFLTGGLRYNHERSQVSYDSILDGYANHAAQTWFNNADPRAVIRYELAPQTSIYASFNQGYKAGTYNATGLSSTPVKPEHVDAYEVGFKMARRGTHVELAGFFYNYSDLQFVSYVGATSELTNAAKARIYGLDAHLQQDVTSHFSLEASAAWTHARYLDFVGATRYFVSQVDGVTVINQGPEDVTNRPMVRTPEFSGRIAADYHTDIQGGNADFNLSYNYQTRVYFDPFGDTTQGAYGLLDARIAWTMPNRKVTFSVYGRNLTNVWYYAVVTQQTESYPANFGEPRNFGGQISVKF